LWQGFGWPFSSDAASLGTPDGAQLFEKLSRLDFVLDVNDILSYYKTVRLYLGVREFFGRSCAAPRAEVNGKSGSCVAAAMVTISEALSIAIEHHRAGRLEVAVPIYRQILALDPDHAGVLHLLGVIAQQGGKNDVAIAHFRRAIGVDATNAEFHNSLGVARLALGEFDEAVACFRRALQLDPGYAEANGNLANAWKRQGWPEEAIAYYQRALQLKPDDAQTHYNLGNVWLEQGQLELAADCYGRALELKPAFAEAHNNLGFVRRDEGSLDEAAAYFRRVIQLRSDSAAAHVNLGQVLAERGRVCHAAASFQQALQLSHDDPLALYNLGNVRRDQGKLDEAISCYRRALQGQPDLWAALGNLVNTLQHVCEWDELQPLSQRLIEAVDEPADAQTAAVVPPLSVLVAPTATSARQQWLCARRWVDGQLKAAVNAGQTRKILGPSSGRPRIKIGYLSADFRAHAVAYLAVELFENHDRALFEVIGYSYGPDDGSPLRRRLMNAFDRFVDLEGDNYAESAQRIAADEVDVLVDLTGYTKSARTQILALRPAPIQVNYLGYPGTMGAPFMDYIVVDEFVVPAEQQSFFTEKLVRLPGCYQINSRREISPRTPTRNECGLPQHAFVFCAFNGSQKIVPAVFAVWMELLKQVPGSVLWLLERNRFAAANLRREAQVRQVEPERLVFAPHLPLSEHLARYRQADLFLDTFPYSGHTTASDALWAGCPVLTIAGQTFASRVAGSLLRTVGLSELVATSIDEYRDRALCLAHDPHELTALRERLQANRESSGLFDAAAFARKLEAAFITMRETHAVEA